MCRTALHLGHILKLHPFGQLLNERKLWLVSNILLYEHKELCKTDDPILNTDSVSQKTWTTKPKYCTRILLVNKNETK
jgi:hypothetical protein